MDEKLLFCVSINCVKRRLYGPEWKETDGGKTLIDLFLQVCGTEVLGQQVQVLVSKERAFLEAAVVQVYTPLIVLAEKSQSYIQFILTSENSNLEKYFESKKLTPTYRNSLGRQDTFSVKGIDTDYNGYHSKGVGDSTSKTTPSFLSKPSFADMTVEEICEEIRRIKTTELSKSTLDSIEDCKRKEDDVQLKPKNNTPPIIKRPTSSRSTKTPPSTKPPPSFKTSPSNARRSPSPAPTRTSKLRSVNNAKKGRKVSSAENASPVNRPPSPVNRPPSPKYNVTPPKLKSNLKASPVLTPATTIMSPATLTTAATFPTTAANTSTTLLSSTEASPTSTINSKKSEKLRSPNLERLSALAKPRRRNSEPSRPSPVKKTTNPIRKASIKTGRSPRVVNVNSRFTKPDFSSHNNSGEASKSSDYFVEFFQQNVGLNSSVKESSFSDESIVRESSLSDVHSGTKEVKQSNGYSSDSLLTSSIDKSNSIDVLLVSDVLAEIRNTSSLDSSSVNEKKETLLASSARETSCSVSGGAITLDSLATTTENSPQHNSEKLTISSVNNTENSSGIPKLDTWSEGEKYLLSPPLPAAVMTSPPRSPLFSSLLEKTQLKRHSAKASKEQSLTTVENPPKKINGTNDVRNSNDTESSHTGESNDSINSQLMKISLGNGDYSLNISGDVPIDSLSLSTSSKNSEACDHSNSETSEEESPWLNSRGIVFTCGKKKEELLNETFLISGKLSSASTSTDDKTREVKSASSVEMEVERDALVSPSQVNASKVHHERKHWANSLKGMDELVVASLQAFSMELRTTSESVASNIRVLYEKWRKTHEETDDEDGDETAQNGISMCKLTPRASPPTEDAGIQRNMAFIFRNLRKIEVKLKTMEQATTTMVKLTDKVNNDDKLIKSKSESNSREPMATLRRNKSFKWKDLKQSIRVQSKSSAWRTNHLHQSHRDEEETSSDSDT